MSSTAPNMGIKYAWPLGTYFKDEMDANLKKLDRFFMPVLSQTTGTPPGSPTAGDRYIIPNTGATGAWIGNETKVATYVDGAWEYDAPIDGLTLRVLDEDEHYIYDAVAGGSADGAWVASGLETLKDNAYSIQFVDMGNDDYTMTDAQANAGTIIVLNAGDSTKTLTRPTSSDDSFCSKQYVVTAFSANGFFIKSETVGGTGQYFDFPQGDFVIHTTTTNPIPVVFTARQNALGVRTIEPLTNYGQIDLTRARSGRVLIIRTSDTTGENIIVPRSPVQAESFKDFVFYFVCATQGCANVIPEDTTVNICFLCDTNYEQGVRYAIHRYSDTSDWYVYKG